MGLAWRGVWWTRAGVARTSGSFAAALGDAARADDPRKTGLTRADDDRLPLPLSASLESSAGIFQGGGAWHGNRPLRGSSRYRCPWDTAAQGCSLRLLQPLAAAAVVCRAAHRSLPQACSSPPRLPAPGVWTAHSLGRARAMPAQYGLTHLAADSSHHKKVYIPLADLDLSEIGFELNGEWAVRVCNSACCVLSHLRTVI